MKKRDFDMILLDIMMPGIDGFEVSRVHRESKRAKRIPVVFITSRDDAEALRESFRSGGTVFLPKPFSRMQLVRLVKSMIGK